MEIVDVVNENDIIIGQSSKSQTHRDGSIHRVVAVIAKTNDDRIIIQKRRDNGKLDHSVGGHVKSGETYAQAVIREAYEELLLEGRFKTIGTVLGSEANDNGKMIRHMFCVHEYLLPENWKFQKTREVREIDLWPVSRILDYMNKDKSRFTTGFLYTIRRYTESISPRSF